MKNEIANQLSVSTEKYQKQAKKKKPH